MANHSSFSVLEPFHLEKIFASSALILTVRVFKHNSFTFFAKNGVHKCSKLIFTSAFDLFQDLTDRVWNQIYLFFALLHAFLEVAFD